MEIPVFHLDVFSGEIFNGNPAAVCPLDYWLDDRTMQKIARENNLSETAFFVDRGDYFQLRWFTPETEVELCGHATLAAAYIIFNYIQKEKQSVTFGTHSGELHVYRTDDLYTLDFPLKKLTPTAMPAGLVSALNIQPKEVYISNYLVMVYDNEEQVRKLHPYMDALKQVDYLGFVATAPGKNVDFVSRFFAPALGIPEDPVTGSAHCALVPYWADQLKKDRLHAWQVSERGGELFCEKKTDRVLISGRARVYMEGSLFVPDAG